MKKAAVSNAADIAVLAPGLVDDNGHCIGKVQAALGWQHGQAYSLVGRESVKHIGRQPLGFAAEYQPVVHLPVVVGKRAAAFGGECKHALLYGLCTLQKVLPVGIALHIGVFVIVQSGTAHVAVFHGKSQRFDQVQVAAGIGGQADDVTCVGWNFRVDKDDVHTAAECVMKTVVHFSADCAAPGCVQKPRR